MRIGAIAGNRGLVDGPNMHRGHVTHQAIAASLGFTPKSPEAALVA